MEMLFSTALFWVTVMTMTPLITMRTLSEERSSGTLETLMTAPISDTRIVLAKYLSALAFYILMWSPTFLFPVLLQRFTSVDPGPILSGYLGVFTMGSMLVAAGVCCSALTRNQIVAAILTFAVLMSMFLLGLFSYMKTLPFHAVFVHVNLSSHMDGFARGIVDSRPLIYYGSVTAFFLFATVQVLGARRWRG
jgi:ABC-2 type transport system permease protein